MKISKLWKNQEANQWTKSETSTKGLKQYANNKDGSSIEKTELGSRGSKASKCSREYSNSAGLGQTKSKNKSSAIEIPVTGGEQRMDDPQPYLEKLEKLIKGIKNQKDFINRRNRLALLLCRIRYLIPNSENRNRQNILKHKMFLRDVKKIKKAYLKMSKIVQRGNKSAARIKTGLDAQISNQKTILNEIEKDIRNFVKQRRR